MKLLLIPTEAVPAADRLRFSSLILFQVNLQFTFTLVAHTSLDFRRQLKILSIYLVRTATNLLKVNIVACLLEVTSPGLVSTDSPSSFIILFL